jgi:hypothetical protein
MKNELISTLRGEWRLNEYLHLNAGWFGCESRLLDDRGHGERAVPLADTRRAGEIWFRPGSVTTKLPVMCLTFESGNWTGMMYDTAAIVNTMCSTKCADSHAWALCCLSWLFRLSLAFLNFDYRGQCWKYGSFTKFCFFLWFRVFQA